MLNKELVSRVKNQLNMVSKDMEVNSRFILLTAQNIAESYISMRLRSRQLYRQDNLYTPIKCVEMEEVNTFECGLVEFRSCNKLMRSRERLPKLIYSRYGGSVGEVTSIDKMYEFKPSTLKQYRRDKNRQGSSDYDYYYINDGYLYIPDTNVRALEIEVLTTDLYELDRMYNCGEEVCKSAWEYEFVVPSDLLEQVLKETAQQVSSRIQIPTDENPNLSSNQKDRTS